MLELLHLMRVVVDYLGSETFSPNHFSPIFASSPFSLSFFKPSLKSETTLSSTLLENANAKIKAIKGDAEQNKSAFAFSKKVDEKTIEKFNKGLEKIRDNGELAKIGKKWFGQDVSKPE